MHVHRLPYVYGLGRHCPKVNESEWGIPLSTVKKNDHDCSLASPGDLYRLCVVQLKRT